MAPIRTQSGHRKDTGSPPPSPSKLLAAKLLVAKLTDKLLTVISEQVTYKVAFGFDKGDAGSVNSSGKKVKEHTERIAEKVLLLDDLGNDDPTSRWKDIEISKLGKSIYQRIR